MSRNNYRTRIFATGIDNFLLQHRNRLQRAFDAEIAAGDHNAVRKPDNVFQLGNCARFFQLGNNQGPIADQLAGRLHILGRLHKRKADPVGAHVKGKFQIFAVFFGNRGNRQFDVGQINPFMARKSSADLNRRHRLIAAARFNRQDNIAVVEQQLVTGLDCRKNFLMRQSDPLPVTGQILHVQHKAVAFFQHDSAVFKFSHPQFRSLQIGHHGRKQSFFFGKAAHCFITLPMFLMRTVAEIKTKGVGAGIKQAGNRFFIGRRRSDGGQNTGIGFFWHFLSSFTFYIIAAL